MAEVIGYSCCPSKFTKVYRTDKYGKWGYDKDNDVWCGLSPYEEESDSDNSSDDDDDDDDSGSDDDCNNDDDSNSSSDEDDE